MEQTSPRSAEARFTTDAVARYEAAAQIPDIRIAEGEQSRTEYVPVPQERGLIARMLFGAPPPKMTPVRYTSPAVERSNDEMTLARNRFALRDQLREEERKTEEHLIGKGQRTVLLLGVERDIRRAEFDIELELEQQRSDRETYGIKREIDVISVETQRTFAESRKLEAETELERARRRLKKERADTEKLSMRLQRPAGPDDEPIALDEIEGLARRATLAAVTGSVAPTTKDRWAYPFAGNIFLAFFIDQQNLAAAQEHTFEAMCDLYMQIRQGRFHLTLEKAEKEYAHYHTLKARAEENGAYGILKDLLQNVTRGTGGKHAFADNLNA